MGIPVRGVGLMVCILDEIGTRCAASKRGCDQWVGGNSKPIEAGRTQCGLEKFAGNLERRLGRIGKTVDRIGPL